MGLGIIPTFECSCGFKDITGQFSECPVCNEGKLDESDPPCFFLQLHNNLCRMDSTVCPYFQTKKFDDCPKLE